jgi:hypothetical protein
MAAFATAKLVQITLPRHLAAEFQEFVGGAFTRSSRTAKDGSPTEFAKVLVEWKPMRLGETPQRGQPGR